MKHRNVILSLLMFLLMTTIAWGVSNMTGKWQDVNTALILDTDVTIDANALEMFVYNDGNFAYDNANFYGKTDGLYFPRGTKKTVIYAGGLWMAAEVDGEPRSSIAEFSSEWVPGPLNEETGTHFPDRADFKVYKVKRGDDASNPDWANWPADMGAPVDENGDPAILGDVMTWSVYNDGDLGKHTNTRTDPMGVEVQSTMFAYARGGALGQVIFMKFLIINKGENQLNNTFVSLWADPDLGDASDDFVGCDTLLSLGYCYNDESDVNYGAAPPSVGYDFFQGPIVPSDGDTAWVSGEAVPNYRNLPMTSFNKYINGTDPDGVDDVWSYMNGLNRDGTDYENPDGIVTKFVHAGNPVTGEGDIDIASADRRWMMTSGPFDMAPGETQEVIAAVLVGQGSNPLNSIDALKLVDVQAQAVFDLNFDIPSPPPSPTVIARGGDGEVDIVWGTEPVGDVQISEELGQEFHFEGYNLYQGESAVGPWHKFATYDIANDITLIYNDAVDPAAGGAQRVIVQKGEDTGLSYHLLLTRHQETGGALRNNQPYFFAVTAYSYDVLNIEEFKDPGGNLLGHLVESLESVIIPYEARPMATFGQYKVLADHLAGTSDGKVEVEFIHPEDVVTADYEVTFNEDFSWNLTNLTTTVDLLTDQTKQDGVFDYDITEGLMVRVQGPDPGFKDEIIDTLDDGSSALDLSLYFSQAYMGGRNASANNNFRDFLIKFVAGSDDKVWAHIDSVIVDDVADPPTADTVGIFRYLDESGDTLWGYPSGSESDADRFSVPFRVFDLGDDYRNPEPVELWPISYDFYGDGNFYIDNYLMFLDKNTSGNKITEDFFDHPNRPSAEYWGYDPDNPVSRQDWDYRFAFNAIAPWEAGDSIVFVAYKPNISSDVFSFSTVAVVEGDGAFIAQSLEDVKTVPNPYYAFYQEEIDQFDRIIKFINLPAIPLTIRIFNISGDLVRTIERTDFTNPEYFWDLKTDSGLWVASGIYVWYIEADGLEPVFGKMAIFTEVEQLNTF